jgi:hypothetical protein
MSSKLPEGVTQCPACYNGLCKKHKAQDSGARAMAKRPTNPSEALDKLYDDLVAKNLAKAKMESAVAKADIMEKAAAAAAHAEAKRGGREFARDPDSAVGTKPVEAEEEGERERGGRRHRHHHRRSHRSRSRSGERGHRHHHRHRRDRSEEGQRGDGGTRERERLRSPERERERERRSPERERRRSRSRDRPPAADGGTWAAGPGSR